ncbi:hypothetical protein PRUPE_1G190400 [Prunus persica]|uniref:Uncharacterized protein n=1 Tax=Prunus persica TaxID=3760 RepID=M5XYR8_PRUPE|nr:hypothetical protein PRUPE_1G190400 [Prunus persica]
MLKSFVSLTQGITSIPENQDRTSCPLLEMNWPHNENKHFFRLQKLLIFWTNRPQGNGIAKKRYRARKLDISN